MNDKLSPQGTISFLNSTNWAAVLSNFRNQIDHMWEIAHGKQKNSHPAIPNDTPFLTTTSFTDLGGYCDFVLRSAWVAKLIFIVNRVCTILFLALEHSAESSGRLEQRERGNTPSLAPQRLRAKSTC